MRKYIGVRIPSSQLYSKLISTVIVSDAVLYLCNYTVDNRARSVLYRCLKLNEYMNGLINNFLSARR